MIARLLISPSLETRIGEISKLLSSEKLTPNHPDLLYFSNDSKLGIEQARIIKEYFSLKPYSAKGRAVVLEDASQLTIEAQNALLKTLEEPPERALLILGARSEDNLLPTILSRCQITHITSVSTLHTSSVGLGKDIEKLINSTIEERFEYIEKLKDRKEFLVALVVYFRNQLHQLSSDHRTFDKPAIQNFLKELLQAEKWASQNVSPRAILEYLMLVMPTQK